MRRLCAVAFSAGARAICCKPNALTDDGRQVPNVDSSVIGRGRLSMICIDGYWRTAAAALLLAMGGSAMAGCLGGARGGQEEGRVFRQGRPPPAAAPRTPRRAHTHAA